MLNFIQTAGVDGRHLGMAANQKFHAISQTVYNGADGNLCCLGDDIQHEGVKAGHTPSGCSGQKD